MVTDFTTTGAPCRYCGKAAFTADDAGPRHSCCMLAYGRGQSRCVSSYCGQFVMPGQPIVGRDDPPSSQLAARRVHPTTSKRRAQVLAALQAAKGGWVPGDALHTAEVGGSEGLRRLRELANDGWRINKRPAPGKPTSWDYRLVEEPT